MHTGLSGAPDPGLIRPPDATGTPSFLQQLKQSGSKRLGTQRNNHTHGSSMFKRGFPLKGAVSQVSIYAQSSKVTSFQRVKLNTAHIEGDLRAGCKNLYNLCLLPDPRLSKQALRSVSSRQVQCADRHTRSRPEGNRQPDILPIFLPVFAYDYAYFSLFLYFLSFYLKVYFQKADTSGVVFSILLIPGRNVSI